MAIIEVSLCLASDSAIISGGLEHGVTISSSLSIFLYKDLMLQCSKERSFDINLSIWLTKSVCVAYCEKGSDRSLSEWLLILVTHSQSGSNSALQCLQSFYANKMSWQEQSQLSADFRFPEIFYS